MSPLPALPHVTLGSAEGPKFLITAGVHGDEYEPMVAVRKLIQEFQKQTPKGQITLIPVVNEAAFRRHARTAEDGQDLARVCPGSASGTPTEQVAAALSKFIQAADFYIDLHTGGQLYDLQPLVGYNLHPDTKILDQQRAMARAFNLPIVWGTQARLEGRSLSVARDANVPALYAEFGGGGGNPAAVDAYVAGCLQVAGEIGIIDYSPPHSLVTYTVEDDRDDAGHLQIQYPAPADGFFQPAVKLGQIVERGQLFGKILDPLGEPVGELTCHESGLVLFLRAVPSVLAGEGLGGLLPISAAGEVIFAREDGQAHFSPEPVK